MLSYKSTSNSANWQGREYRHLTSEYKHYELLGAVENLRK
jgi:hypothetical protein